MKQYSQYHCGIINRWDVSHPPEPYSGIVSRLRNMYPRSTQNTDVVSSINLLNPSISCLISGYLDYQDYLMHMLPRPLG